MSETQELVKVDNPVTIVWKHNFQITGGPQFYDFNLRLHTREGDFRVYANTGYVENTRDTALLSAILRSVLTPDNGVGSINVRTFSLEISGNAASDVEDIAKQVEYAARRAGYGVTFLDVTRRY